MKPILSFIICVNDDAQFDRCVSYIKSADLTGIEYEIKPVYDAKSMTSGYNYGMYNAQGKYKIYMHQDTLCTNKKMFKSIISLFRDNLDIGIIGMVGGKDMHPSMIWSNSKYIYGGVIENSNNDDLLPYPTMPFEEDYKEVTCVDGLFIATQYDIKWRDDLFDGWDFYDASQCAEFNRNGYKICVPNMHNEPWVTHDCGPLNLSNYDKYRMKFIKEYSKDYFRFGKLYTLPWNYNKKLRPYMRVIERKVKILGGLLNIRK